ncbi:MAG: hypothetical protein OEZ06_07035 [Myxococcales bacterium]|nr:hypothetical protein [Myxococcales bacterium]
MAAAGPLMESAAIFKLLMQSDTVKVPKTITLTIDYLRSPRVVETTARARITRTFCCRDGDWTEPLRSVEVRRWSSP